MRLDLYDHQERLIKSVIVPDDVFVKEPEAVDVDGQIFLRKRAHTYYPVLGLWTERTEHTIPVVAPIERGVWIEAVSTRWFSGIKGEARVRLKGSIDVPWKQKIAFVNEDTRPIRVNNAWCPDVATEDPRFSTQTIQAEECRRITNDWCNVRRKGQSLWIHPLAIDGEGRMICDVEKRWIEQPFNRAMSESLTERLTESPGLFKPASWAWVDGRSWRS